MRPNQRLIEPGSVSRREVEVRSLRYLGANLGMGRVVVGHQMDVEFFGDVAVDEAQKIEEILVTLLAGGDNLPGGNVERGEQRGGAVVVVALDMPEGQGRHGRGLGISRRRTAPPRVPEG